MAPAGCIRINENLWEIPRTYKRDMRVPVRIYASKQLLDSMDPAVFEQATNVATLPGIVGYSYCMPDGHSGYGFPIGGTAAFDVKTGIISPGGIGFDINCGMRLVATSLIWEEVQPQLQRLVDRLFARIPAGVGGKGFLKLSQSEFRTLSEKGMKWCLKNGYAGATSRSAPWDLAITTWRSRWPSRRTSWTKSWPPPSASIARIRWW